MVTKNHVMVRDRQTMKTAMKIDYGSHQLMNLAVRVQEESFLCHCPCPLKYPSSRREVLPHSPGLLKDFEDLSLPILMGITEQHATFVMISALKLLPFPLTYSCFYLSLFINVLYFYICFMLLEQRVILKVRWAVSKFDK